MSSCVRPGVCEVRARPLRPVSALISEDLPTFERPAKAISGAPTGGRPSGARRGEDEIAGAGEQLAPGLRPVRRGGRLVHRRASWPRASANILTRLSHSSTFTPAFRMMKYCWMTDSVLFQVQ